MFISRQQGVPKCDILVREYNFHSMYNRSKAEYISKYEWEMTVEQRDIRCRIIRKFLFRVAAPSYVSAIDRPKILVRFIRAKFSGWPRLKRLHWPFSSFDILHIRYILYIPYYGQSEPENANIRVSHIGFTIFTIGFITRSRCARTDSVTAEFQPMRVRRVARQELTV